MGVESLEDLELIDGEDLLPEALDEYQLKKLRSDYPQSLSTGDGIYQIEYRCHLREAVIHQTGGYRKTAPPRQVLPRLPGWTLFWEYKKRIRPLS